jgi:hypothetical protein
VLLVWIAVPLFVIVGIAMILARKQLVELHAIVTGGTAMPGCIMAEAVVLFILAALIVVAHRAGMFQ